MTGTQILDKLEDLREYVEKLEEDVEDREEELEDDKKRLAEAKQRIEQLENEAKNYWRNKMIKKVWINVKIFALIVNFALTTLASIAGNYGRACFHLLLAIMIMVSMVMDEYNQERK